MRKHLLSVNADAKTIKGNNLNFLTGILYLAPSAISGYQVCPLAKKAGCEAACLYSAGRGAFNSVQQARINKTKRFFEDRENFMLDLAFSIHSLVRRAAREGKKPLVRLNGTSDIAWENEEFLGHKNVFEAFPQVQFYDYTKHPSRKNIPANYDLTFSYSGILSFAPIVKKAVLNAKLARIAVVFDKVENIPSEFLGRAVVGGDNSDVRHLDAVNSIVALYAKGAARKDTSGFVVRA
jgi:hypothetical protein